MLPNCVSISSTKIQQSFWLRMFFVFFLDEILINFYLYLPALSMGYCEQATKGKHI